MKGAFRPQHWSQMEAFYQAHSTGADTPSDPQAACQHLLTLGMTAHILGNPEVAVASLSGAVQCGFPPNFIDEDGDSDENAKRQWKNYQDGIAAVPMGMAAELLQQPERRDEILGWALALLVDTQRIVDNLVIEAARAVLFGNYTALVLGQPVDQLDAEGMMSLLRERLYFPAERALAHMMMVVVLTRNGELTRKVATRQLERMLKQAEGGWRDRVQTCFYALHLQSAFPDVLDQVLPPFPTRSPRG